MFNWFSDHLEIVLGATVVLILGLVIGLVVAFGGGGRECLSSHSEVQYTYSYGLNPATGKIENHYGPTVVTVCDQYAAPGQK